jgi:hypothetical protein
VREFASRYAAYTQSRERDYQGSISPAGDEPPQGQESLVLRRWLAARRNEMQRDAQAVNKGVRYVAPPPAIGGGYRPHYYFLDLFDEQSFTGYGSDFRQDELSTIIHEVERLRLRSRHDLYNPWAWVRHAFERVVGFPRYVLRRAGFSKAVTGSTGAKVATVVWSGLVGGATIGGFIVGLLQLTGIR